MTADLTCKVCGARGFDPCDLSRHMATLLGFAAYTDREEAIISARLAEPDLAGDDQPIGQDTAEESEGLR